MNSGFVAHLIEGSGEEIRNYFPLGVSEDTQPEVRSLKGVSTGAELPWNGTVDASESLESSESPFKTNCLGSERKENSIVA
jgi:hypothetical protein